MRLSELCEPFFQYACLLSRSGRRSGDMAMGQVRTEVRTLFEVARAKAESDLKLRPLYPRVELVLMIFMDMTIRESGLSFAAEWSDLAAERGEPNGDERFFDMLDDALRDPNASTETLQVFYTCLGLGFTGWYSGQPEHLRKRQRELAARLRLPLDEKSRATRIVPETYEHVDTSDLVQSPRSSLVGIGLTLAGLLAVVFAVNALLYRAASHELDNAVRTLTAPASATPATEPAKNPVAAGAAR